MKKQAYTLKKMLILLLVVVVIAAIITIPILIENMNIQQYKLALKKALSAANKALSLEYLLYGNKFSCPNGGTSEETELLLKRLVSNHMSVIEEGFSVDMGDKHFIKTTDGFIYYFDACDRLWIDLNGSVGPNEIDKDIIPTVIDGPYSEINIIPSTQYGTDLLYN